MTEPYYQDDYVTIYHGDCREILPELPKVDLVLTDPPYGMEYVPLYGDLAVLSWDAVKEGGMLCVMLGQSYLPETMRAIAESSCWRYHWMIAYVMLGGQSSQLWQRHVNTFWKPVVWYVKEPYIGKWLGDVVRSASNDKAHHHWGQSVSGMADLVSRVCEHTATLLDPFLGSGTTAVAAKKLNRKCIGIEIEERYCEIAANRCRQMVMELVV